MTFKTTLPSNMKERYLTIVLLDIIGSTAYFQRYGTKKATMIFQYHDKLTRTLIYKHAGREIDRSDGFLCSFDSVADAIKFGLAYQSDIPKKTNLNCRIGIHWGNIIEIKQHDYYVNANAKKFELEGINKNIAARVMSLCGPKQILITKTAMQQMKKNPTVRIKRSVLYACIGLYEFKGIKEPCEIYALGETLEALQIPPVSEKAKRLGGPKYMKKRARNRNLMDWMKYLYRLIVTISIIGWIYFLSTIIINSNQRWVLGLPAKIPILDELILFIIEAMGK
jgi:class 3 adenylate cyclase